MNNKPVKEYAGTDTTADILIDKLIAWNVEFIFSLVGDGVNPIFESMRKRKNEIKLITVRHEEAAAFMASGYAKMTGKLGVCLGTTGPGAVHLLNGLYDAALEGAPVLAITGSVPHDLIGTKYTQEVDTLAMMEKLTVFNQQLTGPYHAQMVVDLACRTALMKHGVAHLTVSTDTQQMAIKKDMRSEKSGHLMGASLMTPYQHAAPIIEMEKAATLLNNSNKIAILAGRGALSATQELTMLADILGAPVAKALLGKAVLADDSPYTTGGIGRLGTVPSKKALEECEVLLIVGSTMPWLEYYPKKARAIQIDNDPGSIGLRYPVEIGLLGDVKMTLQQLLPKIKRHEDRKCLNEAQENMKDWRNTIAKLEDGDGIPIRPEYLVSQVSKLINHDAHISIDTGAHTVFTARHLQIRDGQQITACGNLASMAPGLPYAIAAQLAYPGRQCIAMVGDGSLTMLMGELATAVLYGLPVKVIVFKNNSLAMDAFEQEEIGGKQYGIALHPIDFKKIAEACGAEGYSCDDPAALGGVLREAFASERPCVVEVVVDKDAKPDRPEDL